MANIIENKKEELDTLNRQMIYLVRKYEDFIKKVEELYINGKINAEEYKMYINTTMVHKIESCSLDELKEFCFTDLEIKFLREYCDFSADGIVTGLKTIFAYKLNNMEEILSSVRKAVYVERLNISKKRELLDIISKDEKYSIKIDMLSDIEVSEKLYEILKINREYYNWFLFMDAKIKLETGYDMSDTAKKSNFVLEESCMLKNAYDELDNLYVERNKNDINFILFLQKINSIQNNSKSNKLRDKFLKNKDLIDIKDLFTNLFDDAMVQGALKKYLNLKNVESVEEVFKLYVSKKYSDGLSVLFDEFKNDLMYIVNDYYNNLQSALEYRCRKDNMLVKNRIGFLINDIKELNQNVVLMNRMLDSTKNDFHLEFLTLEEENELYSDIIEIINVDKFEFGDNKLILN